MEPADFSRAEGLVLPCALVVASVTSLSLAQALCLLSSGHASSRGSSEIPQASFRIVRPTELRVVESGAGASPLRQQTVLLVPDSGPVPAYSLSSWQN